MRRRARRGEGRNGGIHDTVPLLALAKTPTHKFVRTNFTAPLGKAAADQGFGIDFALSYTVNYTEFTALFDQYRVDAVEVILNYTTGSTGSSDVYPTVWIWPDYDDITAPTTLDEAEQVSTVEQLQFSGARTQFRRKIIPRINNVVNSAGSAVAAGSLPPTWLDCAYPSVNHYGVKLWVGNYNTTSTPGAIINLSLRFHLSFKGVR